MVKTCQADEALEKQFEGLLKRQAGAEVGVLVGKHAAGAKALLFGTIKTPSQEGLDPIIVEGSSSAPAAAAKAGKKPASGARAAAAAAGSVAVTLEVEWIVEHARQVARMLPGGLSVLGLYVFCPEAAAAAASPQFVSALSSLAAFCLPSPAAAAVAAASNSSSGSNPTAAPDTPTHLLLLHIDSGSRKQTLRAFSAAAAATAAAAPSASSLASLRPCELKFAPVLGSLVCVRCWHGVDVALTVSGGGGGGSGTAEAAAAAVAAGAQMRRQLTALVAAEAERLRCGVFVTAGGSMPTEAAAVGEALAACAAAAGGGVDGIPTFDLTLLAPPLCQQLAPAAEAGPAGAQPPQQATVTVVGTVVGQARLRGAVQGVAFVSKREAVGRATADLKMDLLASLTARVELLAEEALRSAEAAEEAAAAAAAAAKGQQGPGSKGPAAAAAPAHPLLCCAAQLAKQGGCDVALPRRVLLPWLGGSLALCDYLLEGEPLEAAAERARDLLALEGAKVLESEQPAAAPTSLTAGLWRPNAVPGTVGAAAVAAAAAGSRKGGSAGGSGSGSGSSSLSCSAAALVSLAVAALAGAVGVGMTLSGQQGR